MSLPNVLDSGWRKEVYASFKKFIIKKTNEKYKELVLIAKDIAGYNFTLGDIGDMGQVIEYEDQKFTWKVTKVVLQDGISVGVTLTKVSSTSLIRNLRITDVELFNQVHKRTNGMLAVGAICVDNEGDAVKVKDICTRKEKNTKKTFSDPMNNPLRKEVWEDIIVVEVYLEQTTKVDGGSYLLPNADFGEKTKEYTLEEFSETFAITAFTTIQELNSSLNDLGNGIGLEDVLNVKDNEQSNALVSTSNKNFLVNLATTLDKRRNGAAVIKHSFERIVELKKRELDIKRRELDAMMKKQKEALELWMQEAMNAMEVFQKQLKKIMRLITTLEIYLGVHENVFQISEGEPAKDTDPIHLFQQFKFMDEEYGDPKDGGLDFSMIEQWDQWLIKDRNFEKIVPMSKGVCLLQVRRYPKDRGDIHSEMRKRFEELDEFVYVIIRNGDNIYRIWSDQIGGDNRQVNRLFPKRSEVQDMLDSMQAEITNRYGKSDHDDVNESRNKAIAKADEEFDNYIFAYKKNILMLQGIIFRTEIFVPVPLGLDLFKPQTHEGKVVFVYDDELSLPSGRLPFAMWREKINSTISKGSRIVLARGYMPKSERNDEWDKSRFVIYFSKDRQPPSPDEGLYSVEEFMKEKVVTVRRTLTVAEYNEELVAALKKDKVYKDAVLDTSRWDDRKKGYKDCFSGEREWYDVPQEVEMQYETYSMVPSHVLKLYKRYDIPVWEYTTDKNDKWVNGKWVEGKSKTWKKVTEKKMVRTMCVRYNPGDTVYSGWSSFDDGSYHRERKVPLTWLIYKNDSFILNYDRISLDDIDFYINDRSTRADYVKALPLLWTIKKKLTEELDWEKKFVEFTEVEIKNETGIDAKTDLKPFLWKAIDWYKFEVAKVRKRPVTKDEAKALRMIKQEAKRLIRDEGGFKKLDTGVDNTKKTLVYKYRGITSKTFAITGVTKAQFLELIVSDPSMAYPLRKPYKSVPELSKAKINRSITDTTNPEYMKKAEKMKGKLVVIS